MSLIKWEPKTASPESTIPALETLNWISRDLSSPPSARETWAGSLSACSPSDFAAYLTCWQGTAQDPPHEKTSTMDQAEDKNSHLFPS